MFGILHSYCRRAYIFTNAAYDAGDRAGFFFGAFCQAPDIGSNGAEALTVLACHRRLDCSIQRQAIRLVSNARDSSYDLVDLTRAVTEQLHLACCLLHIFVDTFYALERLLHRCAPTLGIHTRLTRYLIQDLRAFGHVAA